MDKRFFAAWLVVFLVWFFGSYVVHGVLLHDDYNRLVPRIFRTPQDSQQYFHFMMIAQLCMSGAATWIYARGVETRPWLPQGLRFGVAVALLTAIPTCLIYYVVQPMPGDTVVKQLVFETVLTLLVGLAVAFMYRPREPGAA